MNRCFLVGFGFRSNIYFRICFIVRFYGWDFIFFLVFVDWIRGGNLILVGLIRFFLLGNWSRSRGFWYCVWWWLCFIVIFYGFLLFRLRDCLVSGFLDFGFLVFFYFVIYFGIFLLNFILGLRWFLFLVFRSILIVEGW